MVVANMQKQTPPSQAKPPLDATTVESVIENNDDEQLRNLLKDLGRDVVWQTLRSGTHITNIFHVSARKGALKCLEALFEFSPPKKVFDAPDHDGRTPLMTGVAKAQFEAVELLISHGANINSRDDEGQSALHIIALAISYSRKPEGLLKITDLLLSRSDIYLEPHDENCLTPLATAIEECDEEDLKEIADLLLKQPNNNLKPPNDSQLTPLETPVEDSSQSDEAAPVTGWLFKFCKKLVNKGASVESRMIKEILERRTALLDSTKDSKPKSATPRTSSSEFLDMIILGKSVVKIREFLNKEEETDDGCNVADSKLGSKSLLFYAIDRVNKPLVELLLEAGANPWDIEITDELPIHRAATRGHYDIFNLVLEKMKGYDETVDLSEYSFRILQKIIENSVNQKEISEDINYSKCLTRLMEKDVIMDFNQEKDNETILHVAAAFSNQEALSTLLQHGAFLGARRKGIYRIYGNILPYLLPETLQCAMDGCISYHPSSKITSEAENVLSEDYTLKLDYRFLVPPIKKDENDKPKKINELKTLMEISRSKHHRPVIKHPLIQALLYAKWCKARPLYGINVLIYSVFTILLTFFVYTVKDLRIFEGRVNKTSNFVPSNSSLVEDIDSLQMTVNGLIGGLMIFNVYMLIREIVQIAVDRKIYCNNIENCLEWFLLAAIFVLCFVPLSANWTRHLSAWAMIVAWFELVLILGRASPLTIYITMLRHVSWNIGKFTIVYGLLVLAFTFSFSIILQPNEHPDFGDFWSTLPKMIAMGTGEFEYSSLSEQFAHKVFFHFIFVTFLIFIFLILMNVMIGLAVADTQEVVEDAKLYSLTTRLELLYLGEVLILKLYRWMPFVATRFESLLNRFQFLPGDQNSASEDLNRGILYVKVNKPEGIWQTPCGKNPERDDSEGFIRLNDETAECLRSHHIHHLEEENKKRHGDSMNQEEDKKHCGDMMNKCLRILEEVQQRLQKA